MSSNIAKVLIDGVYYAGWTSVSVRRSIETLCGSFKMESIDPYDDRQLRILPNSQCKIFLNDAQVIDGVLDEYHPTIGEERKITISGRCRTADLIDCSAVNKPGTWRGAVSPLKIINDICAPFSVSVIVNTKLGASLSNFTLNPGESPFEAIQRVLQNRAVLITTTEDGKLLLTKIGNKKTIDALQTGHNIVSATGFWNYQDRFSSYVVRGQTTVKETTGWKQSRDVSVTGQAEDRSFPRYRPKIIVVDSIGSTAEAKRRAAWEMNVRAGKSNSVAVEVAGWTQSNGLIWRENSLCYVRIPEIRVNDNLIISEIEYVQDETGTKTMLTVNPPSIYDPEPKVTKKGTNKEVWGGWGRRASSESSE